MPEHDALADRGRALENEYFRRKDRELVERMRRADLDEAARREMGVATGVTDPAILAELQALGFTSETVGLLPFVPVVQVAWAEGGIADAERTTLLSLARARGIAEGTPAGRQLVAWLDAPPDPQVFANAMRLIRAVMDSPTHDPSGLSADDLVSYCEQIASASGGFLGLGWISADERQLLRSIASGLKSREPR
jgi:hypothetical protein